MKYDPNKSFGYPVLRPLEPGQSAELADYIRASFQPSFSFRLNENEPNTFLVSYEFGLSLAPLRALIDEGVASFYLRTECRATFYSDTRKVPCEGEFTVDGDKLRDWVELYGYVIADADLTVSSDQINEEFGYNTFDAESGSVLACAPPTTYSVEKDFYRNIRSIFEYAESDEMKIGETVVELDKDYVYIYAHPKQIELLRNAEATIENRLILLNSVIFPAVIQMANKLKEDPEESLEHKWANIFTAKCAAKNIDWEGDPMLVAQRVLERPLEPLSKSHFE